MNNAATTFQEAMAENAQQLLLSQGHFERSVYVCPGGREDEKRAVTGVFARESLDGILQSTVSVESIDETATLQVSESEDIQAKDTVLVGDDRWLVTGTLSSDGYLKTMSLKRKTINRSKGPERR